MTATPLTGEPDSRAARVGAEVRTAPPVIRQRGLRAGFSAAWRSPAVRVLAGLAISGIFLALTISRVDLRETLDALAGAAPAGVALAIVLVVVELVIRAERWRHLLAPVARVPLSSAFAYLNIGYFANTVLPARLGDGARAYLAGRSFGISTLSTLGSIVVERVFDAGAILAVVIAASAFVARGSQIAGSATIVAAAAALGIAVVGLLVVVAVRSGLLQATQARLVGELLVRTADGARALRTPTGFALILALTLAPFAVAVGTFGAIATSLQMGLGPAEWALVLGVLALSTALPAAPGSLGTYEFVGVTALGVLGVPASQALAATVLVHVIATVPPALLGLASTLVLHVRIADLSSGSARSVSPAAPASAGAPGSSASAAAEA